MLSDDLDLYLADHGVDCLVATTEFIGILDKPGEVVTVGQRDVVSTMYSITIKSSIVGSASIRRGTSLTADGDDYIVREVLLLDDGEFSQVSLSKV